MADPPTSACTTPTRAGWLIAAGAAGPASELVGEAPDGAVIGAIAALSGSVSGSRLGSVATASGSAGFGGAEGEGSGACFELFSESQIALAIEGLLGELPAARQPSTTEQGAERHADQGELLPGLSAGSRCWQGVPQLGCWLVLGPVPLESQRLLEKALLR